MRKKKGEVLERSFGKELSIDLTSNNELLIYSTISQQIMFYAKDLMRYRYINSGLNIVKFQKLKDSWQAVNKVTIFNYLNEIITFRVLFSARCNIKSFLYKNNSLILNFNYYGPIGSLVDLVVYINESKYDKITKNAEKINFEIEQEIKNVSHYKGQNLVVQVRYDEADPEIIFEHTIKSLEVKKLDEISAMKAENSNLTEKGEEGLILSNYINTFQLLDIRRIETDDVKFDITKILNYLGGFVSEV